MVRATVYQLNSINIPYVEMYNELMIKLFDYV